MIAGAALLVLAAWSPFALLRLIPMMEVAAASVTSQRASMSAAAGIGRHPEPRRLHATGDGPELAAVDLTRLRDDRRNDVLRSHVRPTQSSEPTSRRAGEADPPVGGTRGRRASRAVVELVRRHSLPDRPAARHAHVARSSRGPATPDRFAACSVTPPPSSDATATTPRATAPE